MAGNAISAVRLAIGKSGGTAGLLRNEPRNSAGAGSVGTLTTIQPAVPLAASGSLAGPARKAQDIRQTAPNATDE